MLAASRAIRRERAKAMNINSVGSGAFRVGGGVSAPALLYKVEPAYSEEARAAKYQGTVLLYCEIGPEGRASHIRVLESLGLGLDEQAIAAVTQWKLAALAGLLCGCNCWAFHHGPSR